MKQFARLSAIAALTLASTLALADTPDVAKTLMDGALAEVKAGGLDKAVKELNSGGKWNKGQTYVVLVNFDGLMLAHSANEKIVGKSMIEAKDAAGKAFVKEAIAAAKSVGGGQVEMRWANPVTKQIADATMYVKRVPGQDAYVGSVVFK